MVTISPSKPQWFEQEQQIRDYLIEETHYNENQYELDHPKKKYKTQFDKRNEKNSFPDLFAVFGIVYQVGSFVANMFRSTPLDVTRIIEIKKRTAYIIANEGNVASEHTKTFNQSWHRVCALMNQVLNIRISDARQQMEGDIKIKIQLVVLPIFAALSFTFYSQWLGVALVGWGIMTLIYYVSSTGKMTEASNCEQIHKFLYETRDDGVKSSAADRAEKIKEQILLAKT